MKVYLAGPIANCSDKETNEWREIATERLTKIGLEILNPMRRDYRDVSIDDELAKRIVEDDKKDIDESVFVLANYWKNGAGTSMEIFYANSIGKTVITVAKKPISPWIRYHSNLVCDSLDEAIKEIEQIKGFYEVFPEEDSKSNPIKIQWCNVCHGLYVECPKCGNNSCNAAYGTLPNGEKCNCEDSYKLMYAIDENKKMQELAYRLLGKEEEWKAYHSQVGEVEKGE